MEVRPAVSTRAERPKYDAATGLEETLGVAEATVEWRMRVMAEERARSIAG